MLDGKLLLYGPIIQSSKSGAVPNLAKRLSVCIWDVDSSLSSASYMSASVTGAISTTVTKGTYLGKLQVKLIFLKHQSVILRS